MLPSAAATATASPDQRFALDLQDLDALRRTARQSPEEGLKQVSRQFEALFMVMLLKSMREATPSSGLLESEGGKVYLSMLDQQLAQKLAGRGLHLADAMFAQLRRSLGSSAAPDAVTQPPPALGSAAAASGTGSGSSATVASVDRRADAAPVTVRAIPAPRASAVALPVLPQPGSAAADGAAHRGSAVRDIATTVQANIDSFLSRVGKAAQAASEASGVPAALIVAQAALESGWGRREIKAADGAPSFNLFGIKADRSWRGAVAEALTTEVVDGVPHKVRAKFRAYASYEDAFADYARFLTGNPRYARVAAAADATQAAQGLHRAGYATDPDYAGKLVRIMDRLLSMK